MTKENRLYFVLAFIFIIGISIWLYQSKEINNEDKVELITFEQFKKIESLTKDTISEEGVLYDVSNGILYYPNRNKDRYETMVDLKYPEIFGTAEVLFSGNGSDFHRFVKELVFLKDRNDHAYSDGFKNIKDGAIEGAKDTANGLKNILMHPYESAKGVVQTIANIPAATWGAINGEYSLEGIKNFMEAFYYNEENKNALKNDLIYEKCYLQKTKDEIRQYTNEIIGGNAVIQIVAMLAPGAVISKVGKSAQAAELTSRALKIKEISQITEEVSKLKPALKLEKLADYLFEHKKPAIPSKLSSLQTAENKINFQEKFRLAKVGKTLTKEESKSLVLSNPLVTIINDYKFEHDDLGRPLKVTGKLKLSEKPRINNYETQLNQKNAGGIYRLEGDDGGHLIGDRFDGPNDKINIVAMGRNLNRSEYLKMENILAKAINEGKTVNQEITLRYPGNSLRPDRIQVKYTIDGISTTKIFNN